jgi:hypothetical protein
MLTSGAATVIALISLLVSCLIGGIVGFVVCRVFSLSWNLKVAFFDVVLGAIGSIASAYGYSAIATARGQLDSGVKWIVLTAAGCVAVRHLIRLAFRSAS